jgi:hypothetical protein
MFVPRKPTPGGTISYSDGYRVNCSTGDVYYSGPTA